jgi:hypothetical protein
MSDDEASEEGVWQPDWKSSSDDEGGILCLYLNGKHLHAVKAR